MKQFIKYNKVKFRNEIVICRNGVQVINPSEEMILADGWEEFVTPETEPYMPTYEECDHKNTLLTLHSQLFIML